MTTIRLKDTTDVVRRAAWVGPTEPTSDDTVTVGPGTLWVDDSTTPNVLKRRNDADDGWVAVGLVTGTTAVTAAAGNHNHTHDSLTGRTTDNHHAKAHNVGDAAAHPDVLVTSPATGDALVYDATAVKWKNVPVSGGVTLSSANPTTAAPSDAAAPGTGLSATRGDHRHGMPATWPPGLHAHSAHSGLGADDHTQYQLRSERGSASGYAPLDSGLLVPVANLGTGTPTGSKFLRDDRTWAVPAGTVLTVEEVDGTPSVAGATKLILPNGTVSVSGTEATYTPAGGGGTPTLTVEEVDGSPTDSAITKVVFPNGTLGIAAHVATYTPAAGSSAVVQLGEVVVGVGGAASIAFSSISSSYRNLRLVLSVRGDTAALTTGVSLRFNGDTGANYDGQVGSLYGGGSLNTFDTIAGTSMPVGLTVAGTAPANTFSPFELLLHDYANTTTHKGVRSHAGYKQANSTSSTVTSMGTGTWRSTSAINAITLLPTAGNFAQYTVATLWGEA